MMRLLSHPHTLMGLSTAFTCPRTGGCQPRPLNPQSSDSRHLPCTLRRQHSPASPTRRHFTGNQKQYALEMPPIWPNTSVPSSFLSAIINFLTVKNSVIPIENYILSPVSLLHCLTFQCYCSFLSFPAWDLCPIHETPSYDSALQGMRLLPLLHPQVSKNKNQLCIQSISHIFLNCN